LLHTEHECTRTVRSCECLVTRVRTIPRCPKAAMWTLVSLCNVQTYINSKIGHYFTVNCK
jgi:hypothetical protein